MAYTTACTTVQAVIVLHAVTAFTKVVGISQPHYEQNFFTWARIHSKQYQQIEASFLELLLACWIWLITWHMDISNLWLTVNTRIFMAEITKKQFGSCDLPTPHQTLDKGLQISW